MDIVLDVSNGHDHKEIAVPTNEQVIKAQTMGQLVEDGNESLGTSSHDMSMKMPGGPDNENKINPSPFEDLDLENQKSKELANILVFSSQS